MDKNEQDILEAWKKCKCGGKLRMNIEKVGVEHTYPICKLYDELNLDELIKTPGALARYIWKMSEKAEG